MVIIRFYEDFIVIREPKRIDEITPEWLDSILRSHKVLGDSKVLSFIIEEKDYIGWFSQVKRLRLLYDKDSPDAPKTLIVKGMTLSEGTRSLGYASNFYNSEYHFYHELAKLNTIPTPKCYYNIFTPEEILIVLEDLSYFKYGDQSKGATIEEIRLVVQEIAKFHVYWWQHKDTKQFDWLLYLDTQSRLNPLMECYQQCLPGFFEKLHFDLTPRQHELANQWLKQIPKMAKELSTPPTTIVHGDSRLANLFYAHDYSNCVWIDWQFMVRSRSPVDLSYFLSCSVDPVVRRPVEKPLIEEYYRILYDNGIKDYSFKECWDDYRKGLYYYFHSPVCATVLAHDDRLISLAKKIVERSYSALEDANIEELFV